MGFFDDDDTPPPVGKYQAVLESARGFVSKKGNEILALDWKVASGDLTGKEWTVIQGMSPKQRTPVRILLENLGADLTAIEAAIEKGEEPVEAIGTALKQLAGTYYDVDVVQNGQYVNTNVTGTHVPASSQARSDVGDNPADFITPTVQKGDANEQGDPIPFLWRPVEYEDRYPGWNPFA